MKQKNETGKSSKTKELKYLGILLLSFQFFLLTLMLFSLHARFFGLSTMWFWPFFWLSILCSVIIIYKGPNYSKLISLLLLSAGLSSILLVTIPEPYQLGTDVPYEIQTAQNIIDFGKWDPTKGVNFAENYYGYTPVLHFTLAFSSLMTFLPTVVLTKYGLTVLYKVLFTLFAFLVFRAAIGAENKLTYLSTLIFVGSTGMAFVGVTRRGTASLFVLLALFCLLALQKEKIQMKSYVFFMGLCSLLIVFADRSITRYYLLFLLTLTCFSGLFWLIKEKKAKQKFKKLFLASFSSFLCIAIASFFWKFLFSQIFSSQDTSYIDDLKDILLESNIEAVLFNRTEGVSIYKWYESLLIYVTQILFLGISALGLLFLSREKKIKNQEFLIYFGWFGLCTYALSLVLLTTVMDVAVIIILWFFSLPLCIFTAYTCKAAIEKNKFLGLCSIAVILILFTGSIMTGAYTPRLVNRLPTEDIVADDDIRAKSDTLLAAGSWIKKENPYARLLGNVHTFETIGSFYQLEVNEYDDLSRSWYLGNSSEIRNLVLWEFYEFGSYKHTRKNHPFDFFVVNSIYYDYPSKVFGKPLSKESKERYKSIPFIDKIYSNDNIEVYRGNNNAK